MRKTKGRNIRSYLNEPHKRFRRIRGKDGTLRLSKTAQAYHPGMGVYRSSYKNARRLAVTEVNNAYRQADNDRWQKLDFVVGIRVQLSNNHTYKDHKGRLRTLVDICDDLKGDYPKDFQFTSWHPHCRCIATPILKTREEMKRDRQLIREGKAPAPSKNEVKELPQNFKTWQEKNAKRIARATEQGKLPHWYRDNQKLIEGAKTTPRQKEHPKQDPLGKTDTEAYKRESRRQFNSYDEKIWERTAFYDKTGGYLVRDRERIKKGATNKQERYKFEKETRMCHNFSRAGYRIELVKELSGVPTPDILINGVKADLKSLTSHKTIITRAKEAIHKQGAEMVLFEFDMPKSIELEKELDKLRQRGVKGLYYYKNKNKVHKL